MDTEETKKCEACEAKGETCEECAVKTETSVTDAPAETPAE